MNFTLAFKIRSYLLRDYDLLSTWKRRLLVIAILFLFTSLILLLFKPFGLIQFETSIRYILIVKYTSYPLVIWFVTLGVHSFISKSSFTIFKSILFLLLLTIIAGFTTYFIWANHFHYDYFHLSVFIQFQIMVISTVFIPLLLIVSIHSNYALRQRLNEGKLLNEVINHNKELVSESHDIEIQSKEQNKKYTFNSNKIEYIQSQDNYIKVVTNSSAKDVFIRTTLSNAAAQMANKCTHIFRCHNSYIVNMKKVNQVEGNSAGYKLYLKDHTIPVSRKYVPIVKNYFK